MTRARVHTRPQMLQLDKEHTVNVDTLFGHNEEDGQSDREEEG